MKKALLALILIAALAATAFVVVKRTIVHVPRAAELVPAETILFAQIPDTLGSAQRFTKTALWDILQEPEMEEFMESSGGQWNGMGRRLVGILPREGFVAITSIDGAVPKFVAGFAFSGRQKYAEALVAEWRTALRRNWPAGKADLTSYGAREIETFTDKDFMLAEVFCDGWYFIADDLELLQQTIDRLDRKGDSAATSLAASELYKAAIAPLPAAPEGLIVAQLGTVTERLTALLVTAGQAADPKEFDELKKTQAIAAATKFDGKQCRDTIFVLRPGGTAEAPLARHALALSSPATLLYYAMALPATLDLSEQAAPMLGLIPGWDALNQALIAKDLTLADFPKAFGPEFGSLLDWPQGAETPSVLLALDVRDREKAVAFVEAATSAFGGSGWNRREQDDATIFTGTGSDLALIAPTIALTDKFLIVGLDAGGVAQGLAQVKAGQGRIDSTPAFGATTGIVTAPTSGFGYIDFKTLFERGYRVFKPLLGVSLAFTSEAGEALDAGKLPPAEVFSRHLGPIVYSQSNTERGTLVESIGPVTFNQVLLGVAAGAIGTALPAVEAALADGSVLDPDQLLKSLNAPGLNEAESEPAPSEPLVEESADAAAGR